MYLLFPLIFIIFFPLPVKADVSLPEIFSDHMVLQRDVQVPIWGWADPNERVTVTVGAQAKSTTATSKGTWFIKLDKMSAGKIGALVVKGKNTIIINDVLLGEVWLGVGQSNLVMRLQNTPRTDALDHIPEIRFFTETYSSSLVPQDKPHGVWKVCTKDTALDFSAVSFYFGNEIYNKLKIPVGLVVSAVGGSPIESWMHINLLRTLPVKNLIYDFYKDAHENFILFKKAQKKALQEGVLAPFPVEDPMVKYPGGLFNAMINPLIPYAFRGIFWYQGETNASNYKNSLFYNLELEALINDWRQRWNQQSLPFLMVQLPNYEEDMKKLYDFPVEDLSGWAHVREGIFNSLRLQNTGMAVTIDIGEAHNLHPYNKQEVGRRLALWALAKVYGQDIVFSGPLFSGYKIIGSKVHIFFKNFSSKLVTKGNELKGFAIAGSERSWVNADAIIDGNTVIVSSVLINHPLAVRYAWADNPQCNLFNLERLPASPFRTDNWLAVNSNGNNDNKITSP